MTVDTFEDGYQAAIADMRWMADARDQYTGELVQFQAKSVRLVADIIDGKNDGMGWLPSWLWDEWDARRLSPPADESDPCPYTFSHTKHFCGREGCRES